MPPDSPSSNQSASWLTTLGWAAYLACSWTWCIGMFLPVLLIRDFGLWGFIVFAVPNVIGAAAMGWVLRSSDASRRVVERHHTAVRSFSEVTVAFQVYFMIWIGAANQAMHWWPWAVGLLALVALVLFVLRSQEPGRGALWAAVTVWSLSAGFLLYSVIALPPRAAMHSPSLAPAHIAVLAPVCVFGFGLCPYLDATFNRARTNLSDRSAKLAFGIGFGILFLVMILFTLVYAPSFATSGAPVQFARAGSVISFLVLVHILIQIGFTVAAHGAACPRGRSVPESGWTRGVVLGIAIGAANSILAATKDVTYSGLTTGELIYRLFMSFYGLVFPAYVWLCMIPTRNEPTTQPPPRAKLTILVAAIALAAPFYWMGFIERQTWYLAPGLAIVLLARLFLPRSASTSPRPSPSIA